MNYRYYLTLSLLTLTALVGCNESSFNLTTYSQNEQTTALNATFASDQSKINFAQLGSMEGGNLEFALTWEEGDSFSVYKKNGAKVCDFYLCGETGKDAIFVSTTKLAAGDYTAVHPASTAATITEAIKSNDGSVVTKEGSTNSYLNELCVITSDFTYNPETTNYAQFKHTKAVFAVNSSIVKDDFSSVTLNEGDKTYTINFGSTNGTKNPIIYFLIDENSGSRTLKVTYSNGLLTPAIFSRQTVKDYKAGTVYLFNATEEENLNKPLIWDGTTKDTNLEGSGTLGEPFLITSPAELAGLTEFNGSTSTKTYFKLQNTNNAPFDLGGHEWTPIPFSSTLCDIDGNGIVITNMQITDSSESGVGMFASLHNGSTIKNITITNSYVSTVSTTNNSGAGTIIGKSSAGTWITNCIALNSTVENNGSGSAIHCGGIVGGGRWAAANVIDCHTQKCTINAGTNANCVAGGILSYQGTGWLIGCSSINNTITGAACGGVLGSMGEHSNAQSNSLMNVVGCYTAGNSTNIGIEGNGGSNGGVVSATFGYIHGCYSDNINVLGTKASAIVGKITEAKDDSKTPAQISSVKDMIKGCYTTSLLKPAGYTAQVNWYYKDGASTTTINWNATPTQPEVTINGDYSDGTTGKEINVTSITDTQISDMNKAIELVFTNPQALHPTIKSAKFIKAPSGSVAPYILEIEYK